MALAPRNWKSALSEVLASLIGTLGLVFVIAIIVSGQLSNVGALDSFFRYFSEGQIGLSILAISGALFIALRRHPQYSALISFIFFLFFVVPIVATAIIIGLNPGFEKGIISAANVKLLWYIYFWLHLLWFFILAYEPTLQSPRETTKEQQNRVSAIETGAANRG